MQAKYIAPAASLPSGLKNFKHNVWVVTKKLLL